MKKQILNIGTALNKVQQKSILGGFSQEIGEEGGDVQYQCCWENDPTNCSECVDGDISTLRCTAGAFLYACLS